MTKLPTESMAAHFPGSRTTTAGPGPDSAVSSKRELRLPRVQEWRSLRHLALQPRRLSGGSFDAVMFESPDGAATDVLIHDGVDAEYDNSGFLQNGNIMILGTTVTIGL